MSTNVAAQDPAGTPQPHGRLRVVGGDQDIHLVAAEQALGDRLIAFDRTDAEHRHDPRRRVAGAPPTCAERHPDLGCLRVGWSEA